jgi:hypothetical protein
MSLCLKSSRQGRGHPTQEGDRVRFRIADVFLPSAEEVLALSPATELEGVVIEFSDSGAESRVFAVVDVIRRQNLVVPVEKLEVVASHSRNGV